MFVTNGKRTAVPVTLKEQLTVMLFPNLLNHYIETTSLFMNYSATNFIQLTLKILAFSMLTLTMLRLNVNITKHYLKI